MYDVTEFGLANDYVLRLILAVAAMHLAHTRPARCEEYTARANDHYTAALPVLVSNIVSQTKQAAWMS